jgi:hypothetical protein
MGDAYAPFHLAIKTYWTQLWSPLLDAGEYPSIPDPDGNTALHHLAVGFQKSKKMSQKGSYGQISRVSIIWGWTTTPPTMMESPP